MKMIKILIMLLVCQMGHAKTVELLTSIQKEGLSRVVGKFITDNQEVVRLIGTSRVSKMPSSKDKIIRIVWTGVDTKEKGAAKYFETPLMMTLAAPKVKRGTKLRFSKGDIKSALGNLRKTKSKAKLKDKYSGDRKILMPVDGINVVGTLNGTDSAAVVTARSMDDGVWEDGVDRNARFDDRGNLSSGSMSRSGMQTSSKSDRKLGADRYGKGRGSDRYRDIGYPPQAYGSNYPTDSPLSMINGGSSTTETIGLSGEGYTGAGIGVEGDGLFDIGDASLSDPTRKQSSKTKTDDDDLFDDDESMFDPTNSQSTKGRRTTGDGSYGGDSESMFGSGRRTAGDGSLFDSDGDPLSDLTRKKSTKGKTKTVIEEDDTRIEITCDGCTPRIDEENNRVFIQNKSVTYKHGEIQSSTECTDSWENYLIKQDYLCEHCQDFVDLDNMTACPTFVRYWTNGDGMKTVLSTQPEKDLSQEFPIISDKLVCEPYIDADNMQAFRQVELVYQDRVNARKIAKACHRADSTDGVEINLTMAGCTPTHSYENDWSVLKMKGVFELDGRQYTAFGCREEGRPIPHQYDTGVCSSNINIEDRQVALMGRRYVMIEDVKHYLSECEPIDSGHVLMETAEGCEGQFVHSQAEGRSYLMKKWYYNVNLDKQFVTSCQKSTEFIAHQAEITGYENNDANRKSKQITTVYIEYGDSEREDLYTNYINPNVEPIPYELVSTTNEPTDSFAYAGCFKITQTNRYKTYTRGDGTTFKQFLGVGTPLKSGDLCRRTTENKDVYHHTHIYAAPNRNGWGIAKTGFHHDTQDPDEKKYPRSSTRIQSWTEGEMYDSRGRRFYSPCHTASKYFSIHKRTITHYPNGTTTSSKWIDTGEVVKRHEFWSYYTMGKKRTKKFYH